jgi:hypothetical protein
MPSSAHGVDPAVPSLERCSPNIGPSERRKRLILGCVSLSVSALTALLMALGGAPLSNRLLLALPLWTGCLGIFQARGQVCVALAATGQRSLSGVREPQPAEELAAVRREARRIHVRAALAALVLTLLSIVWP